jgi:hypothetical protein
MNGEDEREAARIERLAKALRANLARRKMASRAKAAARAAGYRGADQGRSDAQKPQDPEA